MDDSWMPRRIVAATLLALCLCASGAAQSSADTGSRTAPALRTSSVPALRDPRITESTRLSRARALLASAKPLTISVLCDSVGNDPGEWVSQWARTLADDRVVTVRHFDWKQVTWSNSTEVFAPDHETTKGPVTVWNFGWPGGTPLRAAQHLEVGVPTRPDLAIVSFGHNLGPAAVVPHYTALDRALTARWGSVPTVTTVAHMTPVVRPGQAEGRVRLVQWLRARALPYVDERTVFDTALAEGRPVFHDAVHPNLLGYRLISDLIASALAPGRREPVTPTTYDPKRAKGSLFAYRQHRGNRTTTITAAYVFRDGYGRPLPHAWVTLQLAAPGGTSVALETDAAGRVTGSVRAPNGISGALSAIAADGFTTVSSPVRLVRAR